MASFDSKFFHAKWGYGTLIPKSGGTYPSYLVNCVYDMDCPGRMHRTGTDRWRKKVKGQLANPASPGKWLMKRACVCCSLFIDFIVLSVTVNSFVLLLLTPTTVAGVKRSSASVCVSVCLSVCLCVRLYVCLSVCLSVCMSVCLSVCPHDRTKTAETTVTKLATGIVRHESSLLI